MSHSTRRRDDVPIEVVREHLMVLRAAGLGRDRIGRLSGVHPRRVHAIINGSTSVRDGVQTPVRAATAAKLLAVRPDRRLVADDRRIGATGTRRRLQALVALGWCRSEIARRSGLSQNTIGRAMVRDGCALATARAVHRVYEEMWDQRPPVETGEQRCSASHARREAARKGWAPPMLWDDETIDDPAASPAPAAAVRAGALDRLDELQWMLQAGESFELAARRVGYRDLQSAREIARRHGHPVAHEWEAAA